MQAQYPTQGHPETMSFGTGTLSQPLINWAIIQS